VVEEGGGVVLEAVVAEARAGCYGPYTGAEEVPD
jgi:hypothetical protein